MSKNKSAKTEPSKLGDVLIRSEEKEMWHKAGIILWENSFHIEISPKVHFEISFKVHLKISHLEISPKVQAPNIVVSAPLLSTCSI